MTGQELATAMQYGAKIKVVISDNGIYGTIRTHQERHYPGRISGTDLQNPDFAAWGKSFGAHAVTIQMNDDIAAKVKEALDYDGPAVIHVKSSREALSAFTTLSALGEADPRTPRSAFPTQGRGRRSAMAFPGAWVQAGEVFNSPVSRTARRRVCGRGHRRRGGIRRRWRR